MTDMFIPTERIRTGIPELDSVLHGGLLRNRIHLIEGRPGTGKTTFGLRYLIEGKEAGQKCLYLSLSEAEDELRQTAASHGWSLGDIDIVEMIPLPDTPSPQTILLPTDNELNGLVERIGAKVEQAAAVRVVIDSMVEIRLLARDSAHYRRQVIALRERLSKVGATVVLLDDITSDGREFELQSAVHGVITLEYDERSFGAARRRLHVVKLRGGDFQSGWHDYAIETGEILVFPSLIAKEHHRANDKTEVFSGVGALDDLFGGPLTAGSSTMILGPSGIGKTTLALQYAAAAVKAGYRAAYFNFDESETTLQSRMVLSMGEGKASDGSADDEDNQAGSESHRFFQRRVNPSRISPGQFIWNVRRMVEDQDVRLVIIDSINSYLDVIREEKSLLPQMNELFSYLSNMSVMVVVVGAHSARLDTSKEPDAVSIITDNIISMRYYERDNVVCKAICVFKKRQGQHEHEIRELELTNEGIRIGGPVQAADREIGATAVGV
ncbi:circadian clock protein KaiC [Pseudoduganella lurida]|uniref:Circadian clock protein KaiC n=1 Tax=Pseudoduganella lurida TaxID=1036180 RepID=A0A562RJN7_9BURK|nr:ATPase domain-containing protein [Pseudoduganella lurida]TWI69277.1 circadian clock protein KaiC [Pseudoduganella lurida]